MRRALPVLVTLVALLAGAPARADREPPPGDDPASYAVVAIQVAGDADPELRAQVQQGLARGVARTGAGLVGYDEVQRLLAARPALVGCLSRTCLTSIAEVVGTPLFLRIGVTSAGATYEVELELLGIDGPIRRRTASCTVCTVADLADLVGARVQDLLSATTGGALPVEIATVPAGATIEVAGAPPGTSPWRGELPPGDHAVTASKPGFRRATRTITVVDDGREQRFELALVEAPAGGGRRWTPWAIAGASIAALVTGGVLIALDGTGTCDGAVTCPEVRDTGTAGILVGVAGLAGAGVSGWLIWRDRTGERAATVTPTATGAAVRIRF